MDISPLPRCHLMTNSHPLSRGEQMTIRLGVVPNHSSLFKAGHRNAFLFSFLRHLSFWYFPADDYDWQGGGHRTFHQSSKPEQLIQFLLVIKRRAAVAALHRIWPPLLTGIIICQIGLDWGERTEPGYAPNILFPFFSRLIRPSLKLIKEVQTKLLNPSEKLSFSEKVFCGHVY